MLRGLNDIFESWQSRLRTIIDILETSEVNEIEVSFFGRKIRVSKGSKIGSVQTPAQVQSVADSPILPQENKAEQTTQKEVLPGSEIKSPMVGTFYRSPSPESPPFVNEGDSISSGQVICIIEAMKIMNEIESDASGRITKINANDGDAIEYGQPLFYIDPD
ncbi:MAG: acetyl-CoA carboxylase, biotin carboxyl carrier protein [Candidatus Marinimicrobia bacterium]|nr:acetyl-CoA carboxylase, biotin carboxyl carrier protein [Candidatus Neomarinimicrobiota bacterium]|tara:strand:- start:5640 stop:6125 length:486 start_codon:yes stop_codon:yes gene_type:complete